MSPLRTIAAGILLASLAWTQPANPPSNPTLPIPGLTPGGPPILFQATASASGPITTKPVKTDSTVQATTAPDGSILITAVPQPPGPTVVNRVLWIPATAATTQPPGQSVWCLTVPVVPNWSPVAIVESRVTASGTPISYSMFYLVSFPSQAQGAATPDGLTWTRTSSFCAGGPAINYTPASLPSTDQRLQVFVMVTG